MIPPQANPRPRNTWKYAIHKVSPNSIHLFNQFFPISGPNVLQKMSEGKTSQYMTFLKQVRLPELIWALPNLSLSQASINRFSSWSLNQPIWKICSSNWIIFREIRDEILKEWNHQLVILFPIFYILPPGRRHHVDAGITLPSHLWPIIHAPPITVMTTGTLPLDASQLFTYTLPETNIVPKDGWLEYYFPIEEAYFQRLC